MNELNLSQISRLLTCESQLITRYKLSNSIDKLKFADNIEQQHETLILEKNKRFSTSSTFTKNFKVKNILMKSKL